MTALERNAMLLAVAWTALLALSGARCVPLLSATPSIAQIQADRHEFGRRVPEVRH